MVNYYKELKLDPEMDIEGLKEVIEGKHSEALRRLNNAYGSADREYRARKDVEIIEDALKVFGDVNSRQEYDRQLQAASGTEGSKGFLLNEMIGSSDEERQAVGVEGQDKGNAPIEADEDSEKIKRLLEKKASAGSANAGTGEKTSPSANKAADRAMNHAKLAMLEITEKAKELLWHTDKSFYNRVSKYLERSLEEDMECFEAWKGRFMLELKFSGRDYYNCSFGAFPNADAGFNAIMFQQVKELIGFSDYWDARDRIDRAAPGTEGDNEIKAIEKGIGELENYIKGNGLPSSIEAAYNSYKSKTGSIDDILAELIQNDEDRRSLKMYFNKALEFAPQDLRGLTYNQMVEAAGEIYSYVLDYDYQNCRKSLESFMKRAESEILALRTGIPERRARKAQALKKEKYSKVLGKWGVLATAACMVYCLIIITTFHNPQGWRPFWLDSRTGIMVYVYSGMAVCLIAKIVLAAQNKKFGLKKNLMAMKILFYTGLVYGGFMWLQLRGWDLLMVVGIYAATYLVDPNLRKR